MKNTYQDSSNESSDMEDERDLGNDLLKYNLEDKGKPAESYQQNQ